MGYEGNNKGVKVTVKNGTEIIPSLVTNFPKKDSLQIWLKPIKADSLEVAVAQEQYSRKFMVKIKNQKADTLSFSPTYSGSLPLRERFSLSSSIPLVKFDKSKISLTNKDSIAVRLKPNMMNPPKWCT